MAIRFSLAQHTVPDWSPAEMIYNAAHLGYDMVGIRMILQGIPGEADYDMVKQPRLVQLAQEALEQTGIRIHDIDLASIATGRPVAEYRPYLELARKLGCESVVSSIWTEDVGLYLNEFAKLCDIAAEYGLTVYLEFVTWASVHDLKTASNILDQVKRPNSKILLDSIHCYRSGVQAQEIGDYPLEWFDFMHLCDAPAPIPGNKEELIQTGRTQQLYPGEGAVDNRQILQHMSKDKVIGLEIPHDQRRNEYGAYEHARRCLESAKTYLRQTGILQN